MMMTTYDNEFENKARQQIGDHIAQKNGLVLKNCMYDGPLYTEQYLCSVEHHTDIDYSVLAYLVVKEQTQDANLARIVGTVCRRSDDLSSQLVGLETEKWVAVRNGDYERAAGLRDKIKEIEGNQSEENQ